MSRKRMRPSETLDEFYEVKPNDSPEFLDRIRAMVGGGAAGEASVNVHLSQKMATNGRYTVSVRDIMADDQRPIRHLSIKRNDRDMIDDWRVLQQIKNIFAGEMIDAVQVFPRESHLVDSANQWHLWCFMDGKELPYGYKERLVGTPADAGKVKARQRPF